MQLGNNLGTKFQGQIWKQIRISCDNDPKKLAFPDTYKLPGWKDLTLRNNTFLNEGLSSRFPPWFLVLSEG